MKKWQKIIMAAAIVVTLLAILVPFVPIGREVVTYDFNNGTMIKYKKYFWGYQTEKSSPSNLTTQMRRLKMPKYPKLETELHNNPIILMRPAEVTSPPPWLEVKMLGMEFGPMVRVPLLSEDDLLNFRDEILNEFGGPELIAAAKAQGAARGGYLPDAKWERK
ncbi:MAG: hypothetical protein PHI85_00895 [Victivallaceae bacterium]|nr:hypothetical protein [Victivallaceae bacterium]